MIKTDYVTCIFCKITLFILNTYIYIALFCRFNKNFCLFCHYARYYLYFCSMKVVIAIDSFKGCLSSKEANEAAAEGISKVYPDAEIIKVTVSDGGEGYMEAFHAAIGGKLEEVMVRDPLMRHC